MPAAFNPGAAHQPSILPGVANSQLSFVLNDIYGHFSTMQTGQTNKKAPIEMIDEVPPTVIDTDHVFTGIGACISVAHSKQNPTHLHWVYHTLSRPESVGQCSCRRGCAGPPDRIHQGWCSVSRTGDGGKNSIFQLTAYVSFQVDSPEPAVCNYSGLRFINREHARKNPKWAHLVKD